jgi:DNA-binding transcriptional MerR regulator
MEMGEMKEMTLREVCKSCGVSRRAVQGYEKAGLISATGRNERGYLLYDENSQERIKRIKLFQQMGFSINEIGRLIDAPKEVLKPELERQIIRLKEDKRKIEITIEEMYKIIDTLS